MNEGARFPESLVNQVQCDDLFAAWGKLPDDCLDLIVTSPPYYNAKAYAIWPTYADYVAWLARVLRELARTLKPGRRLLWNICDYATNDGDQSFLYPISADSIAAALAAGLVLRHWIIWQDENRYNAILAPSGTFPHGPSVVLKHTIEFVMCFQKPLGSHPNQAREPVPEALQPFDEMGQRFYQNYVKNQVWYITAARNEAHPAPFPEALVEPIIRMWSRPGELVADPFMGSGTTAVSALLWRRRFYGSERDRTYWEYLEKRIRDRELAIATDQYSLDLLVPPGDLYTKGEAKAKQIQMREL